jgi:hypothetical protein
MPRSHFHTSVCTSLLYHYFSLTHILALCVFSLDLWSFSDRPLTLLTSLQNPLPSIMPGKLFKVVQQYFIDAKAKPEILPVTGIVIGACSIGTYFMGFKLFNTPDVSLDHSLSYQKYDAKNTARHAF